MSDYIDPNDATRIRIFQIDKDEWQIDAADDAGGYTEACWDARYEEVNGARIWGPISSLPTALALADDFARENAPHLVGSTPHINDNIPTQETIREEFLSLLQGKSYEHQRR